MGQLDQKVAIVTCSTYFIDGGLMRSTGGL
jgi:hypothetical protein